MRRQRSLANGVYASVDAVRRSLLALRFACDPI